MPVAIDDLGWVITRYQLHPFFLSFAGLVPENGIAKQAKQLKFDQVFVT